jgi:hypothetical protein
LWHFGARDDHDNVQPFFLIVSDAAVATIVDYDDVPVWSSNSDDVSEMGYADRCEDGDDEPAASSWLDRMLIIVRQESHEQPDEWEARGLRDSSGTRTLAHATQREADVHVRPAPCPCDLDVLMTSLSYRAAQVPTQRQTTIRRAPDRKRVELVVGESHGSASIGKDMRMNFVRGPRPATAEDDGHVRDPFVADFGAEAHGNALFHGAPYGTLFSEEMRVGFVFPEPPVPVPVPVPVAPSRAVRGGRHTGLARTIVIESEPESSGASYGAELVRQTGLTGPVVINSAPEDLDVAPSYDAELQSAVQTRKAIEAYFAKSKVEPQVAPAGACVPVLQLTQTLRAGMIPGFEEQVEELF